MKLQIVDDSGILLEINNVNKPPYGIEVVNDKGGVSLSATLRGTLTEFFYHLPVAIKEPIYTGNVVPFRPNQKLNIPVVQDTPEIS